MFLDWISDPSAWVGLATLIVLEIVLGIDNLVFIAILADKLPPHQRDQARLIGLALALLIRLALLASIAWVVTLTTPLFTISDYGFFGRDIILIIGGLFLLFKGTMELHERLEGHVASGEKRLVHAVFWQVIVQIVVLDAVFSLDSVITAVGMVQHLPVMMIAVIIAVGVMVLLSKPLTAFVGKHPTVVILCLGFLMMIGFSLIVEGFGVYLPKGYLYAAIGFSVTIEALNQLARHNRERLITPTNIRERTADAVLNLLGGKRPQVTLGPTADLIAEQIAEDQVFSTEEKDMIQGVLTLAERSAKSVMTPRMDIDWLDLDAPRAELRHRILDLGHSRFPVARGSLDNFIGIASARDLLRDIIVDGAINAERSIRQPLVVHESISALKLMEQLRQSSQTVAIVLDEYGDLEGMVTPTDLLEAIAGEFPDEDEEKLTIERGEDGSLTVDGWIDIRHASRLLDADLIDETDRYSTLAGFILWHLGHLPHEGEGFTAGELAFEVVKLDGRNIDKVRVQRIEEAA
ncbi:Membrane protein TerC, possibly involved in tellurium resistance [Rhizobium tibeticum]|uniref:Hemolysin C n=1 Tax=Rhizobium tibeticum TaxID=501024 RepID=A0A1H8WZV9_9HYPH|nr:TerC family protein [Rhizobium tibeticum]SEI21880.1 Hemolysin C [Rhizobium tibeticum]SEP33139.1 Membrane protein TerC, possibly involved in tellurium resistance [Rhizobium tibeticum]